MVSGGSGSCSDAFETGPVAWRGVISAWPVSAASNSGIRKTYMDEKKLKLLDDG